MYRPVGLLRYCKWKNIVTDIAKKSKLFQAEARLAARRQARYEARNIRMKELEKKQKEDEENQVNHNNIYPGKKPFSHH